LQIHQDGALQLNSINAVVTKLYKIEMALRFEKKQGCLLKLNLIKAVVTNLCKNRNGVSIWNKNQSCLLKSN
jgi:hypothetical protein